MVERLPLVWWLGARGGGCIPLYPVYLLGEERADLQLVVDLDAG